MNYGNLIYNKIRIRLFFFFYIYFRKCWIVVFVVFLVCFVSLSSYFKCDYLILCDFLCIWRYFKDDFRDFGGNMSQKCDQYLFEMFCDLGGFLGPKWSPPSPASMSKLPSRGNKYGTKCFLMFFMKNWKMY